MSAATDARNGYEMGKRGAVIVSEGYCPACHEVKAADDGGSCQTCGDPLIDLHERFSLPDDQAAGVAEPISSAKAGDTEPAVAAGTSAATARSGRSLCWPPRPWSS